MDPLAARVRAVEHARAVSLLDDAIERGEPLDAEATRSLCARAGRNEAPALLAALHEEGLVADDGYRAVGQVWSMAEWPERCLDRDEWVALFEAAGFTVDGQDAPRPDAPVTLYRGGDADGMSWTADPEVARWFAARFAEPGEALPVWTAVVEPEHLLARLTERGEDEVVVDIDAVEATPERVG